MKASLTVFFEDPFWVGVFERIEDGKLAKVIKAVYPAYYENDGTLVLMEGETMKDDGLPEKGKNYIFVGTAQPDGSIFLESLYAKPNITMTTIKGS